jgi:methionine-rich copper-binding protein CopC
LDAAKESEKAAEAALAADEANQPTNYAAIAADQNTLAQAQATLPIYEAALQRAQQTSQAIAATATAATPGTQSGPTISSYFGQPTWNPPYTVSLPNQFPPILYAIDDTGEGDNEKVTLTAVQSDIKDTKVLNPASQADLNVLEAGVNPKAQPTFETVITRPALTPSTQTIDPNSGKVTFQFSQPINDSPKVKVQADAYPPTVVKQTIHQSKNNTVLEIDFDKNPEPGNYAVGVNYSYHAIVGGSAHVKFTDPMPGQAEAHFTVQKPGITILSPASQTVDAKSGSVSFSFSKSISKLGDVKVSSGKDAKQVTITPSMAANNTVLNLAFTSLSPGDYTAVVNFFYAMVNGGADVQAQQMVKFTVK